MITDRDITCRAVAAGKTPVDVPVSDVMTRHPYIVHVNQRLGVALEVMNERLVRRLPVVDDDDNVVGIVSQADLVAKMPTLKVARLMKSVFRKTRKFAGDVS